jgi:hypothetical protein
MSLSPSHPLVSIKSCEHARMRLRFSWSFQTKEKKKNRRKVKVKVEVKVEVMELALKRQRAESAASITMLKLFAPVFRLSGSPPSSRYHRHIAPHQPPAPASGSAIMLSQHVAVMKPPQRSHAPPTAKDSARATAHSFFSPPVATGAASFFPSAPPPGAGDPPSFFSRTPPAPAKPPRAPPRAPLKLPRPRPPLKASGNERGGLETSTLTAVSRIVWSGQRP